MNKRYYEHELTFCDVCGNKLNNVFDAYYGDINFGILCYECYKNETPLYKMKDYLYKNEKK